MGKKREIEYEYHKKGEPLYVSETERLCPFCNKAMPLSEFKPASVNSHYYSKMCVACLKTDLKLTSQEKRIEAQKEQTKAVTTLTDAITKATKRGLRTASLGEAMNGIYQGRSEDTYNKIGKAFDNVLTKGAKEDADLDTLRLVEKIGATLLRATAAADKNNMAPTIDWDSLTEDEMREILFEPARALLLKDERFRRQLVNVPDVRRLLLVEVGGELIDVPKDDDE